MKIEGIVNYVFKDAVTGEVTRSNEVRNHIQKSYFRRLLNIGERGGESLYTNLFISSQNPGRQSSDWETDQIKNARTGVAIPGISSLVRTHDLVTGNHLIERAIRFSPPAEETPVNMVGLCRSVLSGSVQNPEAVVWLNTPTSQLSNETLDIFYRVKITEDLNFTYNKDDIDSLSLNYMEKRKLIIFMLGVQGNFDYIFTKSITSSNVTTTYNQISPLNTVNFRDLSITSLGFRSNRLRKTESPQVTRDDVIQKFWKYRSRRSYYIGDLLGKAISWLGVSVSTVFMRKLPLPNGTPLQNVFGHNDQATVPFYNPLTTQNSLGNLILNADNWTDEDNFGQFLKVDIKTNGLVGVGEYNFRRQPFFGFNGNTYYPESAIMPTSSAFNGHVAGFKIGRDFISQAPNYNAEYRYGMADSWEYKGGWNVLFLWINEFCIIDVKTGLAIYPAFNNERLFGDETIPRFLPTHIKQHYVCTGDDILIACRDTGLYIVNPVADTLKVVDSSTPGLGGTTGCHACCEGFNGRIYGFFGHTTTPTIYYSDNNGDNWTSTGMFDSEWTANMDLVWGIQADVNAADGHLAIIHSEDTTIDTGDYDGSFSWYNVSTGILTKYVRNLGKFFTGTAGNGSTAHCIRSWTFYFSHVITCSPNQSKWCTSRDGTVFKGRPIFYTAFEGAATTPISGFLDSDKLRIQWIIDKNGNDAILYLPANGFNNNGSFGGGEVIVISDGTTVEIYYTGVNYGDSVGALYLQDGVWLRYSIVTSNNTNTYIEPYHEGEYINRAFLYPSISVDRSIAEDPSSTYAAMSYPVYGWNGSAWEKGHPGLKTIHSDAQELFHGVTVAFDDNGGVDQFFASDHYTTEIFDGIVMDGSTSFDYEQSVYIKPVEKVTDIESPTLPVTTKVSNIFTIFTPDNDTQFVDRESMNTDATSGLILGTGNGLDDDYSGLIRSATPAIFGGAVSFLPNNCVVPDSEYTNALGWVDLTPYMDSGVPFQAYVGLSNSTVLGTVADPSTIQYAFHIDSKPNAGGSNGTATISVIESGIPRASATGFIYGTDNRSRFRIILLNSGKMVYQYLTSNSPNWVTLYESPSPAMVPLENFHLDILMVPRSNRGFELVKYNYLDENNDDYYFYIGNGADNGLFDPEFNIIDPSNSSVFIDGQEAVNLTSNDSTSTLITNQVSIFYNDGVVRYSSADIGKTVTAEFLVVKN